MPALTALVACATGAAGEKWPQKVARLRRASPFGHLAGWGLRPVIVKSGDDCRQELMAVQIISKLQAVFVDSGLPLWLRPFEVRDSRMRAHSLPCLTCVCGAPRAGLDHVVARGAH